MTIDLSQREVEHQRCDTCGAGFVRVLVFAAQGDDPYAIISAWCHGHPGPKVWMDITVGSWVEPYADHITVTCLVTPEGAGLYDSLPQPGEPPHRGRRLTRGQALEEPRLALL